MVYKSYNHTLNCLPVYYFTILAESDGILLIWKLSHKVTEYSFLYKLKKKKITRTLPKLSFSSEIALQWNIFIYKSQIYSYNL